MKKFLLLCLMILTMGISGFSQETTITIGTGTSTTYYAPFDNFYKNSWVQMIYPATEINEAGLITSISFDVSDVPSSTYTFSTLTIYMGTTSDTINTSTSSWLPMADLTEVYTTTNMDVPSTTGWLTFQLDTPFPYDGIDNLVIVTSKTMPSYASGLKFFYTSVSNSCMYRQSDSDLSYASHPGSNTGTRAAYRPNMQLTISASTDFCHPATQLTVSNLTTNDAYFSWHASADAVSYIFQYKTADESWDNAYSVTQTDTTYELTGDLTANTLYQARVAGLCSSGDTSGFKTITFKTPCDATTSIPYTEGFEGYSSYATPPDCWTLLQTYSTSSYTYPYINNSTTNAHTGSGYLYSYGGNNFVALPAFDESIDNLRLTFWMKPVGTTSAYGRVEVGVMSDLNDASSFQMVAAYYADSIGNTNWHKYTVDFDQITPSDTDYIVIRRYVSSTYGWYFDDFTVDMIPACDAPTQLSVVDATPTSATLFWNPGEGSTFTIYYKEVGDDDYSEVSNIFLDSDSTYTLTNLENSTTYVWYVATICGDGTETASDPTTFATTMIPVDLPYATDFSENADQSWLLNNGTCTNYWAIGDISDTASALFITNDGTNPGYSHSISIVSASKLFNVGDAAQFQISFDLNCGGESFYDYIKLFFAPATESYPASSTTPTSTDWIYYTYSQYAFDFSDYASSSTYSSATTYPYRFNLTGGNVVHIDAIMPNPNANPDANSTAQLVFGWRNDGTGGTQPGAIISNVSVSVVSCPSPENLTVSQLDDHSATLTWDESNEVSAWTVEYGEHGFTLGDGTVIPVSGTPEVTLNLLTANTSYDVYVQSNCSDGSNSINILKTFTTPCEPLTTLPYTENFDSVPGTTSSTTNNLPYCWSYYNHGTSYAGYPIVYASATYAASGDNSVRFYSYTTTGTYDDQIAILPQFDPTLFPINTLQLSFDARNYSSYTFTLVIGVMSNPSDKSTFMPLDTLVTTSNTYSNYDFPLNQYTGSGNFIAIMAPRPTTSYNAGYIDNLVVDIIPDCPKPHNLSASSVGSNSIDLTWTEVGSATEWEIEYGPHGFTPGTATGTVEIVTNEPPYTISGLTSNTPYDFYIRSNCGSDYSAYSAVLSISTACDAIDSLPYAEGFDTYGTGESAYPSCWGKINTYSSNRPYVNATHYAGVGSLYFYAGTSGTYNIAVMPPFDASIDISTLQATFMYRGYYASDRLIVGVMTNPTDASTFVPVDTIYPDINYTTWVERDVMFSQYTGTGQYIAFKNEYTSTYGYAYLDNLVVDLIPDCPKPTQIHVVSSTTNSLELGWTENGDATSWEIEYGLSGDTVNTTVITVTDNPYTFDYLSPSSIYDFIIKADCGSEMSEPSSVFSASTACGDISQLPYVNGFDAYGTGTTAYPTCWGKINTYTSGDRPYVSGTNYSGVGSLYFYAGTSGTYNIAITPQFDATIDINTLQASFMYRATNSTDRMIVGVMTNPTDATTFVPVDTVYPSSPATAWVEKEVIFNQYTGTGHYIAFKCEYTTAAAYSYIDNLMIGLIPACPKPNQLHIVSSTSSSIELGWTENGDATSWEIEYGPVGFAIGNGTTVNATSNPFTVSNLTESTTYDFYIRANCGSGDMSDPSFVFTASTECEPIDQLPYTEDFDAVSGASSTSVSVNNLPICWNYLNGGSSSSYSGYPMVYNSSTYSASGSNSMRFYIYTTSGTYDDQIAILPPIDPAFYPMNTLQLSFDARNNSTYTFTLVVGIMSNPADKTTFVPIDTIVTTSNTYANYEIPFSQYTGTGNYIALFAPKPSSSYNSGYVDNIMVDLIPSCSKPHNVTATDVSDNSITLSWTPVGTATAWDIIYGTPGFDLDTEGTLIPNVTSTSYTVTGLTNTTTYQFYVRSICGGGDYSAWSNSFTQSTSMVAAALPYQTNFATDQSWLMNNGAAPNYWMMGTPSGATAPALFVTNDGASAGYSITSASVSMAEKLFTMPSGDSLNVVFDVEVGGEGTSTPYDYLKVFLAPATEEFTPAAASSNTQSSYSYTTNALNFSDYISQTGETTYTYKLSLTGGSTIHIDMNVANPDVNGQAKVVFLWRNDGSAGTQPAAIIRNFSISAVGDTTVVVTDPTVATSAATAIAQTSATLNGTITNPDNVTITAKGFEWKATAGGTYAPVTVTGDNLTYNLTSLTANTGYTYKAFITYNGTTVYGQEVTFTTLPEDTPEPCDVPTGLTVGTVTHESIAISWDANANVSSWNIQYRPVGGTLSSTTATTNSYTITGLNPETQYQIQVQAVCSDGQTSDWTAAVTATTLTGIDEHLLNSIVLFPNPAKEYINVQCTMYNVQLVEVFDVYGKLINTVSTAAAMQQPYRINVSGLASGMYFVRVTTEQGVATKSFVKK